MTPEIFDIENGKVVVNSNCLLIPELKAVVDRYTDPIPALCFLHYKFAIKGPYCNTPEDELEDVLQQDFPGEYTTEDEEIIMATNKLSMLYETPTVRYYNSVKGLLERLGVFAKTAVVTTGRDGNMNSLLSQVRTVGKTINEFKVLEKSVLQELDEGRGRNRGDKKLAYDQS
jgi:hypothetical protein